MLAVDGNSLVHRGYHALASSGARSLAGEPAWAVRGLLVQLVHAVERIGPTTVVVGFDDPDHSVRRLRLPAYKAQRAEKLPTLVSQLALAESVMTKLGAHVVVPAGLEADDVLASVARHVGKHGGHTVAVTSDRDAFALICEHTSVLRIINGGVEASPLLTPDRLELMLGIRPEQYRDFAALRGDPSDNLPGVHGVGPKSAAKLLSALGTAEAVFADVEAGGARVRALVGPRLTERLAEPASRAAWKLNCELMGFVDDLAVGVTAQSAGGRLPFDAEAVRRAFALHQLPGTTPAAMRTLAHTQPPTRPADLAPETLAWDPTAEHRWRRTHPPLPVREEPRVEQLTLF